MVHKKCYYCEITPGVTIYIYIYIVKNYSKTGIALPNEKITFGVCIIDLLGELWDHVQTTVGW